VVARAYRGVLNYRWLLLCGALILAGDRLSKAWIVAHLAFGTYGPEAGAIVVIPGFFDIVHVGNTGAAWSLFTGRSVTLAALAVATLAAIFVWRRALGLAEIGGQVAFGLLCGGIVGNLIDRIVLGHVVDFIDLHFGSYIYPTFNVADCGICLGVGLYLLRSFIRRSPPAP
jgi:signal peptidase II